MIVCHCRAVNHREIEDAVADGARTVSEVTRACGAGGVCGGCTATIADLVPSDGELPAVATETPAPLPSRTRTAA